MTENKKKKTETLTPTKTPSAVALYVSALRRLYEEANPTATKDVIDSLCMASWNALDDCERDMYECQAAELVADYNESQPEEDIAAESLLMLAQPSARPHSAHRYDKRRLINHGRLYVNSMMESVKAQNPGIDQEELSMVMKKSWEMLGARHKLDWQGEHEELIEAWKIENEVSQADAQDSENSVDEHGDGKGDVHAQEYDEIDKTKSLKKSVSMRDDFVESGAEGGEDQVVG